MGAATTAQQPSVIIVGAGFGGLGTGIELLRAGFDDVTVLERADGIGGVWRENTYPNAACDVPSSLYSWSFATNPSWGHRYSRQPEILAYIESRAREHGIADRVRTGVEVTGAVYDEQTARWTVSTSTGERLECDVLVPALGQLSRPVVPDLPGLESFRGPSFHSARWDHEVDLRGKRVAVIGTGASAIQFVPGIVDEVGAMTVFQRSAPYVVPKPDRAYTRLHNEAFRRLPATQRFGRRLTWVLSEQLNRTLVTGKPFKQVLRLAWRILLRLQVRDPGLRARLVPDYPLGCKRLLFSNDWYPALDRDHVDLVTEAVREVRPDGVVDSDGRFHPADVIIHGTGFAATQFIAPMEVTGRDGHRLGDLWHDGARAHLGISVPGFPNLFLVYGPNTNLGGSSVIGMLESQSRHIVAAVRTLADGADALEVRQEVADAFDEEMQARLGDSVWASCSSWYREGSGRITTNWPGLVAEYERRTGFDPADYRAVDAARAQVGDSGS